MLGTPTTKVAQQNTTVSGDVMISSPHARFGSSSHHHHRPRAVLLPWSLLVILISTTTPFFSLINLALLSDSVFEIED
jgi:hypothetical protein